jgi:beta-lactamase regulating signal transducer with metallopeptidase domain
MSAVLFLAACRATLLAGLGLLLLRLVPLQQAQLRRWLSLALVWSLLLVPWLPSPVEAQIRVPSQASPSSLWLTLWLAGSLFALLRLALQAYQLRRLLQRAQPSPQAEVWLTHELDAPCVVGWLRPCILLPSQAQQWKPSHLAAALSHERQHIAQRDGLHYIAASLTTALFWWNPWVWHLAKRYRLETEVCCDEAALLTTRSSAASYGNLLVDLASARLTWVPSWSGSGALRERLLRMMEVRAQGRWAWLVATAALLTLAFTLLSTCCIGSSALPLQIQEEAQLRISADPFPG